MKANELRKQSLTFQLQQIYCSKGKPSEHVCSNKKCTQDAFVCQDNKCECKSKHQMCFQTKTQSLIDILAKKAISMEPFIKRVQDIFEKFIDELSDMRDSILLQFKQNYQIQGLSQIELKFYKAVKQRQTKQIKCKNIAELLSKVHDNEKNVNKNEQIEKDIQKIAADCRKQLKNFQNSFEKYVKNINFYRIDLVLKSNIVKVQQDETNLIAFFPKKIKSISLLYRASQQNFQISKFHEKCDGIPHTLVLIQTQFDKIIGGYTPLVWKSHSGEQLKDQSGETFIFSLSHNDKLIHDKSKTAIYSRTISGPIFGWNGGNPDIYMVNQSNKTASYTGVCWAYNNPNYKFGESKSWQRFNGNATNQWFKIKQWEVWRMQFQK